METSRLFHIKDKTSVVTGGASGIGLGLVKAMAENGGIVTIMDINKKALEVQVQNLRQKGYRVNGIQVDVTDRQCVAMAFKQVVDTHGKLDICFANAGLDFGPGFSDGQGGRNPDGEIDNLADEVWDRNISVMLTGVFNTVKVAAKYMKPNRSGSIIVTTSVATEMTGGMVNTPYMPAKAGARHFVRQVALDLAKYNIRVNAIAPGGFITSIGGGVAQNPEFQEILATMIPLGHMVEPPEITGLALFLASDASRFITGTEISIDGGMRLGPAG